MVNGEWMEETMVLTVIGLMPPTWIISCNFEMAINDKRKAIAERNENNSINGCTQAGCHIADLELEA